MSVRKPTLVIQVIMVSLSTSGWTIVESCFDSQLNEETFLQCVQSGCWTNQVRSQLVFDVHFLRVNWPWYKDNRWHSHAAETLRMISAKPPPAHMRSSFGTEVGTTRICLSCRLIFSKYCRYYILRSYFRLTNIQYKWYDEMQGSYI
jgi:hypothetical protein